MAPKFLLTKESSARAGPLVQQGKEATGSGNQHLYWLSAYGIHGLCWLSRGERSQCFLCLKNAEMHGGKTASGHRKQSKKPAVNRMDTIRSW